MGRTATTGEFKDGSFKIKLTTSDKVSKYSVFFKDKKFELGKLIFNFNRETYSMPEKLVKFFNVVKTADNTMNFLKNAIGIEKNSKVFSIFDKYGTKTVKTIEDVVGLIGAFIMIYFDLDNTLIDYNSSERKAIEFIFKEKYGLVLNNNQTDYWSKISRKYFDYYLSKQITFEEQGKNRFIKMLSYCGYVENEKIAMELFEEYQKQLENSWILFDDVVDMLHSLEGYRLGIISNGKSIQQRAKLSCTNIEKYFEIILISEETGFAKPSVDIFYEAVKQSGEKIDSVIYVGDNIKTDILPCEKIGMKCVLVDRNSICEKNICKIKNLYEIHNVLLNDIGQYNTELSIRSSAQ